MESWEIITSQSKNNRTNLSFKDHSFENFLCKILGTTPSASEIPCFVKMEEGPEERRRKEVSLLGSIQPCSLH